MLQAKYLKFGTCWIVTSGVIRDQLAELYILKKDFLILDKKIFWAPPKQLVFGTPHKKNIKKS